MKLPEPQTKPRPLYSAISVAELLSRPPKEWTIPNVLPASGIAVIYGASNVGKTFLTIDLIAAIAEGGTFLGATAKARKVIFVGLEGADGLGPRFRAWETYHGRPVSITLKLMVDDVEFSLDNDEDVEHLAQSIAALGAGENPVICIDTFSAAMMGLEENSTADMGAALKRLRRLRRLTGAMILLIAHSGKDSAKGVRGSSKLPADCDTIMQVKKKAGNKRVVTMEKQRAAKIGTEWMVELREVAGQPGHQASCVMVYTEDYDAKVSGTPPPTREKRQARLGPKQQQLIDVLTARREGGENDQGTLESDAFLEFKARFMPEDSRAKERFADAMASLVKAGRVIREAGRLRLA